MTGLAVSKRALDEHLVGDVVPDGRDAHDFAGGETDERDGQGDVDPPAVLPDALRGELADRFAGSHSLDEAGELMAPVVRSEEADGLADHLVGAVAVDTLRTTIPAHDDAVEGGADDGVVGVVGG